MTDSSRWSSTGPRKALDAAMAESRVVSPKPDQVRAWNFTNWGERVPVDVPLARANPDDIPAFSREMVILFDRTRAQAAHPA